MKIQPGKDPKNTITSKRATWIGFSAIAMWSTLAWLVSYVRFVPSFQLLGLSFGVASLVSIVFWFLRRSSLKDLMKRVPFPLWILGIGGLFGYHFFYFLALRNAPVIEASLIAYLWPLLIVLFSSFVLKTRLKISHFLGGFLGLCGTWFLLTEDPFGLLFKSQYLEGYFYAGLCALIWSIYSVLLRRFQRVPTEVVGLFCFASSILGFLAHAFFEVSVWTFLWRDVLVVLALGIGPIGLAFFTWDIGMKQGNIRFLGVSAYLTPLFSTFLLILFGQAIWTFPILLACLFIVGGTFLASLEQLKNL